MNNQSLLYLQNVLFKSELHQFKSIMEEVPRTTMKRLFRFAKLKLFDVLNISFYNHEREKVKHIDYIQYPDVCNKLEKYKQFVALSNILHTRFNNNTLLEVFLKAQPIVITDFYHFVIPQIAKHSLFHAYLLEQLFHYFENYALYNQLRTYNSYTVLISGNLAFNYSLDDSLQQEVEKLCQFYRNRNNEFLQLYEKVSRHLYLV